MCSCRLNWTDWCALAGFRSACQWPKLVPTALAWWSSNSACFQKLPLPKVMLWNLHGFEIYMIDQWKLWWCYIFLDRVSSNKNETNIHYFPYRSLSRIKHVFWFAGCFWKLKKDNWYILKGFSICSNCIWIYLHPNLTGEMAMETKKTCGHETNRTAADITTGWYHTTTGCTHSSLQCTWYCTFSSVKQRWRLNCGAIVPNSIFYFTELKASTKNKRSSKKNSSGAVSEPSRCSKQYVRIFINAASAQLVLSRKPLSLWCKERQDWIFQAAIDVTSAGRGKTSSECG